MNFKHDFPIFTAHPELHYLDHAATSQKPSIVIDRMTLYYQTANSSPNRGAHKLSVKTTELYELAKHKVKHFLGAKDDMEVIFTKNATEANNLVAYSYALDSLKANDIIMVGIDAHHSIIVPLQYVAKKTGAILKYIDVDASGEYMPFEMDEAVKLVAFPWISNALGVKHDAELLVQKAHAVGAKVLVDGAQAVGHMKVDLSKLNADFLTFSAHKMFGPQGMGALVAKRSVLDDMPPFLMGGDMIEYVEQQDTTYAGVPKRFEAGTQNVGGAVGLMAAIDYIEEIGVEHIEKHETDLMKYALEKIHGMPWIKVIGSETSELRNAIIAFEVDGVHPHDVASLLDEKGVAIRAGHHCAQPLMKRLGVPSSCRMSFSIYNDYKDIDALVSALKYVREVFQLEC